MPGVISCEVEVLPTKHSLDEKRIASVWVQLELTDAMEHCTVHIDRCDALAERFELCCLAEMLQSPR